MNPTFTPKSVKIISGLSSLAVLTVLLYMFALFHVERTHAADPLFFSNVEISGDSMRPLALNIATPTSVDASVNASEKTDTNVKTNSNSLNASVNSDTNEDVSTDDDIPVSIQSSEDLNLYTKTLQEQDKDISKVETNDDHILVSYREPAKFLGFIPVSVTANAKVDANGNVTLIYPWYTFLSVKDDANLKANLKTKIAAVVGSNSFANLSARERAEVIQTIHTEFKGETK